MLKYILNLSHTMNDEFLGQTHLLQANETLIECVKRNTDHLIHQERNTNHFHK